MSLKKENITTRKKISLSEGFLDGDEDSIKTAESAPAEEEASEEGSEEGESDISDEVGEGDEDLDSDGDGEADEFEGDGEDAGVEEEEPEEEQDLKDTMQSLITAVQELTDKIAKQNGEGEEGSEDSGSDDTASEDDDFGGDDTASEDDDSDFEGDEESSEESSDEGSEEESSDEGSEEESSEESSDDETKSEAYNFFAKAGRPLNEKSNYLIGKIAAGRYDLLEEPIMAIVRSKIKQRIEGAKKEFRAQAYKEKYGE